MIIFFGFGILIVGVVFIWGGITGTMPAVLAAVFDPSILTGETVAPLTPVNKTAGEALGGLLGGGLAGRLLQKLGV